MLNKMFTKLLCFLGFHDYNPENGVCVHCKDVEYWDD